MKITHTGSRGHSQLGKSCAHLYTGRDYTSLLTSPPAPVQKYSPLPHSSFHINPSAKGTSPASPSKSYSELCSHKMLATKASSHHSCQVKGKPSRISMPKFIIQTSLPAAPNGRALNKILSTKFLLPQRS